MSESKLYNLSFGSIVEECKLYSYVQKGIQKRVIIIPNGSLDSPSRLVNALNAEGVKSTIDKSDNPPSINECNKYYGECYVIDFRRINLID